MPIIGMSFRTVEAKRDKDSVSAEINVNSTPKITSVKEINVPSLNKKALSLSFEFTSTYNPKVGEIKIGGEVLYLTDKNKSVLAAWKKDKKLPDEMRIDVLNHLFRRCMIRVSTLADDLQLPPPLPMPRVNPEAQGTDYVG